MAAFSNLSYNVGRAIDFVKSSKGIRYDQTLSKCIGLGAKTLASARKRNRLTLYLLVRLSEFADVPTQELRYLSGDRRFTVRQDKDHMEGKYEAIRREATYTELHGIIAHIENHQLRE